MTFAKKELGQNFLVDGQVPVKMAELLNIEPSNTVVEIGPGTGAVTSALVRHTAKRFLLLELDNRLIAPLNTMFGEFENLEVLNVNVLDWIREEANEVLAGENVKIIGSLPYYITSPILHRIVYLRELPEVCVFLIQKEVAQKVSADVPDSNYLSAFLNTFFDVEFVFEVGRELFDPVPGVDGGVVVMRKRSEQLVGNEDKRAYEGFLHRVHASPRKMLNKVFSDEELDRFELNGSLRPQNVGRQKWVEAYCKLK